MGYILEVQKLSNEKFDLNFSPDSSSVRSFVSYALHFINVTWDNKIIGMVNNFILVANRVCKNNETT